MTTTIYENDLTTIQNDITKIINKINQARKNNRDEIFKNLTYDVKEDLIKAEGRIHAYHLRHMEE